MELKDTRKKKKLQDVLSSLDSEESNQKLRRILQEEYPDVDPDLAIQRLSEAGTTEDRARFLTDLIEGSEEEIGPSLRSELTRDTKPSRSGLYRALTDAGAAGSASAYASDIGNDEELLGPTYPPGRRPRGVVPGDEVPEVESIRGDEKDKKKEKEVKDEIDIALEASLPKEGRYLSRTNPYDEQIKILENKAKSFANSEDLSKEEEKALAVWREKSAELKKAYNEAKDRIGWAQAAELLGKGLAQLAIGLYGLRTGVNVSGARFDTLDWSKRFDQELDEYRTNLTQAYQEYQGTVAPIESKRRQLSAMEEDVNRLRQLRAAEESGREKFNVELQRKEDEWDARRALAEGRLKSQLELKKMDLAQRAAKLEQQARQDELTRGEREMANEIKRAASREYQLAKESYNKTREAVMAAKALAEGGDKKDIEKGLASLAKVIPPDEMNIVREKVMDPFWDSNKKKEFDAFVSELEDRVKPPVVTDYMPGGRKYDEIAKQSRLEMNATVEPTTTKIVSRAVLTEYANKYKISEEAARDFLTKAGYTVE